MKKYELAQLNIAHMTAPIDSPVLKDFVSEIDRINTLAENSPGFVWRLKSAEENALTVQLFGNDCLVNLSVWQNVESLFDYVYKTAHTQIMRRRREWFHPSREANIVLWWIAAGCTPTLVEAKQKLDYLREHGPTPDAFTFKKVFPPNNN